MAKPLRAALYLRVSTDGQTTENQRSALMKVAEHRGWEINQTYEDAGISGAKGRDKRPGFDQMLKEAVRGRFNVEWYADSPLDYGNEIEALRDACLDVQRTPWSEEAAVRLVRFATSVMRYHDTVPGDPLEEKRRQEMQRLIDLLIPSLDEADLAEVKRLLPDIAQDTSVTEKAAGRLQTILKKVGKTTYDIAIEVISDLATEAAKKFLGLKS